MASERYVVRVTKDHLVFCSGHFISYAGHQCERLHGHNYRATVEVEGPLDENFYVFDFIALKQRTKEITDELDTTCCSPQQTRSSRSRSNRAACG
ncbi:MAG TPA: 6-carboxytetrahydropterin synthase [Fimbriiglobus sp.]|nr:6-carboxytetrahydropterin synthase [Fimbriiglobus sp.]